MRLTLCFPSPIIETKEFSVRKAEVFSKKTSKKIVDSGTCTKEDLLSLEKSFFQLEFISDKEWLDAVICNRFVECGKSGALYNKTETV